MARKEVSTTFDKQKILWAIVLFLVVGYVYGRPTLEKWIGRPLPTFGSGDEQQTSNDQERSASSNRNDTRPESRSGNSDRNKTSNSSARNPEPKTSQSANTSADSDSFFRELGRNQRQSPAGLIYGMGPGGEHRVDHVMEHALDDPSRPVHSVFAGTEREILETIDEAWTLAQKGGRGVQKSEDDDRTEYTIRMNRNVGYEGGESGKRKNFPKLQRIKLVVEDGDRVVTAYPYR